MSPERAVLVRILLILAGAAGLTIGLRASAPRVTVNVAGTCDLSRVTQQSVDRAFQVLIGGGLGHIESYGRADSNAVLTMRAGVKALLEGK